MIVCDACYEWFHGKCVGITELAGEGIDYYVYTECKHRRVITTSGDGGTIGLESRRVLPDNSSGPSRIPAISSPLQHLSGEEHAGNPP